MFYLSIHVYLFIPNIFSLKSEIYSLSQPLGATHYRTYHPVLVEYVSC